MINMLDVHQINVTGLDKNFAYIVINHDTHESFLVDPSGDWEAIAEAIASHQALITGILITHTHHDHIDKLDTALTHYDVPVYVHTRGADAVASAPRTKHLADGDAIILSNHTIDVIYTPGHIDDHVVFYIKAAHTVDAVPKLISGDALFVEGCGRTTPTRVKDLYESLQELKALPDSTEVYPGHDYGSVPHSTIAHEKTHNKYLQAKDFNEFKDLRLS